MYTSDKLVGPQDADLRLANAAAIAADANGASVDLGEGFSPAPAEALTVQGVVSSLTGGNGAMIYVQESADDSTFYDTGDFLQITANGTYYKICSIGMRYVRLRHDVASSTYTITAYLNRG